MDAPIKSANECLHSPWSTSDGLRSRHHLVTYDNSICADRWKQRCSRATHVTATASPPPGVVHERWCRARQRPLRCFIAALCLAVACTTARDESRWLNSPGGGIVRVVPLESAHMFGSKSTQVALHVSAAGETLFVSRCGRADLNVSWH